MITAYVPGKNDDKKKEIDELINSMFTFGQDKKDVEPIKEEHSDQFDFDRWLESELQKTQAKRSELKPENTGLRQNPSHDPVNHPSHYTTGGIETIDFIEAKGLGFCLGNVVKYVARAGKKDDKLEDLKKARWYLDREIASLSDD